MLSKGKKNVEVATKLDILKIQIAQFRLHGQDNFESLYKMTKGR